MITEIFYHADNFSKEIKKQLLEDDKKLGRPSNMTTGEIITICVYFHYSCFRNFKAYYKNMILKEPLRTAFPKAVSYSRFVELMQENIAILGCFALACCAVCTGISFIDSTSLSVCLNPRIPSHKVMKRLAKRGKTSIGWFYGFKLHIIMNHLGEIVSFAITPGNVDDRNQQVINNLTKKLFGKLFGDRGYLSAKLFQNLWNKGIKLVTGIKHNMKNILMDFGDKIFLKKRGSIESLNNILKSSLHIQHTRHRSEKGFFGNVFSAIAAYSFYPNKPAIGKAISPLLQANS